MSNQTGQLSKPLTLEVKLCRLGWPPGRWTVEGDVTTPSTHFISSAGQIGGQAEELSRCSTKPEPALLAAWIAAQFSLDNCLAPLESHDEDLHLFIGFLRAHCIEARDRCIFEENFAAGGSGFNVAVPAAEDIFPPESLSLKEFRVWNQEIALPWHSANRPCTCDMGNNVWLCDVCYQFRTRIKRPWYIEFPEFRNGHGLNDLCEDCSHVDFNYMFNNWCKSVPLGSLRDIHGKQNVCSFCRLLSHTLATRFDGELLFDAGGHPLVCTIFSTSTGDTRSLSLGVTFETHPGALTLKLPGTDMSAPSTDPQLPLLPYEKRPSYHFKIYRVSTDPTMAGGRPVPNTVDFGLLKEWIGRCDMADNMWPKTDSYPERSERSHSFQLRVIDVSDLSVKTVRQPVRYLALSYVWGGPQLFRSIRANQHRMETPGGLGCKMLPQTIQDAITVVSNIGERYLWVDSLCIIQDDPDSKNNAINAMDKIFEGAVATIVAKFGENANAGLLGIRPNRVRTQHREKVQGLILVNSTGDLEHTNRGRSIWCTRAWTFQEEQLSRRLLEFGENGVIFRSEHGTTTEQDYQPESPTPTKPEPHIYGWIHKYSNFRCYIFLVREYTSRELSDRADILNAFKGILEHLRPMFRGDFVFGLPITEIDISLLWRPSSVIKRRTVENAVFPSWSWSGWVGQVEYGSLSLSTDLWSVLSWIDPVTNKRFMSDRLRESETTSGAQWQRQYNTSPFHYYEASSPTRIYLHPIAPEEQRAPISLILPGSQHLHFVTLSSRFPLANWRVPRHEDDHDFCYHAEFGLFTMDGFLAGSYTASNENLLNDEIKMGEFIALSKIHADSRANSPVVQKAPRTLASNEQFPLKSPMYSSTVEDPGSYWTDKNQLSHLYEAVHNRYRDWYVCEANGEGGERNGPGDPFDRTAFDPSIPWCLYNVMLIEWRDGVAYRVGIGTCHIDAFHRANPVRKHIVLG